MSKSKFVSYHCFMKWMKQISADLEELKKRIEKLEKENMGNESLTLKDVSNALEKVKAEYPNWDTMYFPKLKFFQKFLEAKETENKQWILKDIEDMIEKIKKEYPDRKVSDVLGMPIISEKVRKILLQCNNK